MLKTYKVWVEFEWGRDKYPYEVQAVSEHHAREIAKEKVIKQMFTWVAK